MFFFSTENSLQIFKGDRQQLSSARLFAAGIDDEKWSL